MWAEEYVASAFKYLISFVMVVEGMTTIFLPSESPGGSLGWVYSSRISLTVLGVIFIISGLMLLVGKLTRSKKLTGDGILAIYLCFLFATILQFLAFGSLTSWLPNAVVCAIMGGLWLRWKYKTVYINPKHFQKRTIHLRDF